MTPRKVWIIGNCGVVTHKKRYKTSRRLQEADFVRKLIKNIAFLNFLSDFNSIIRTL